MKYLKRIAVLLIIISIAFPCNIFQKEKNVEAANYGISNPRVANNETTWDCIYFGSYYQSSNTEKEPIKWRVLSVNGDEALLLSDKILDRFELGEEYLQTNVTWETSKIREWMNSDFYSKAFSVDEKGYVIRSFVENKDFDWHMFDMDYHEDGGRDTYDKVFNLSLEEVNNKAYGFVSNDPDNNIFYSETRYAEKTNYVGGISYMSWWLRTPGYNHLPCVINAEAPWYIYFSLHEYFGIRPAIRINLNNSLWKKADSITATHDYINRSGSSTEETTTQEQTTTRTSNVTTQEQVTTNSGSVPTNQKQNGNSAIRNTSVKLINTQIYRIQAKKKSLKVYWKRIPNIDGVTLQYSRKKNFKKAKTLIVKNSSVTSKKIKKLKRKKKYFVRIRTYRLVDERAEYSAWSKRKSKKTK